MRWLPLLALSVLLPAAAGAAELDLQKLLERYPAADANHDGVLTPEEARAYAASVRGGKSRPRRGADEAPPRAAKPAPTHANVSYGPHERHRLDLWLAPSPTPAPLLVYIHGGGFVGGSKDGASAEMIRECLAAGVSFMAIEYRFRPVAPIQDILRDCARSIQFVRWKAKEYHLDPTRIAAYGGSAGAGSSLWLAFHPDLADPAAADPVLRQSTRLVAAGALNTQATYNLLRWPEILGAPAVEGFERPGELAAFYGVREKADLAQATATLDDVDMLKLVSRDDPPVFLFTSHPDGAPANRGHYLHHPGHARAVQQACAAAGVPAVAWFSQCEPRLAGDHLAELRKFLLRHLRPDAPAP